MHHAPLDTPLVGVVARLTQQKVGGGLGFQMSGA